MPKGFSFLVLIFFSLGMGGCFNGQGLRSAEYLQSYGWAGVGAEDSDSEPPLYCYKTLGVPDCYDHPQPNQENRLVTPYPVYKKEVYPSYFGFYTAPQKVPSQRHQKPIPDTEPSGPLR
jgi:hypothetical protein